MKAICILLQTENDDSTPSLSLYRPDANSSQLINLITMIQSPVTTSQNIELLLAGHRATVSRACLRVVSAATLSLSSQTVPSFCDIHMLVIIFHPSSADTVTDLQDVSK